MKIYFDENTKEIRIIDGASTAYKMQKIALGLTLLSQILLLIDLDLNNISILNYVSIILIFFSLGALLYYFTRVSVKSNIKLDQILGMKHKKTISGNTFSFKLKNGKIRTLTDTTKQDAKTILPFCKLHKIPLL